MEMGKEKRYKDGRDESLMKSKCLMEVEFPDIKAVGAAAKALSHEGKVGARSKSRVTKKKKILAIEIAAGDVVALRATANSYLRALQVFENIHRGVRK